jgi:hypothetical protein
LVSPYHVLSINEKEMSIVKVLSINERKNLAFVEVQGEESATGLIPTKSGLIRTGANFKLKKGESVEDEKIDYVKVKTRESVASIDGKEVVFNWLLY